MKRLLLALAFTAFAVTAPTLESRAADPDALWKIVNGSCVPDEQQHKDPKPCTLVNLGRGVEKGYVVIKDASPDKPHAFLLLPTAKIAGIESQDLLFPDAPNYFAEAWRHRALVAKLVNRPLTRRDYSLAVNSTSGRTQNQLHIHIDCVRSDVRDVLAKAKLTTAWRKLDTPLAGQHYFARRIRGDAMVGENPFTVLADGISGARASMGDWTIAVIGAPSGFYELADKASPPTDFGAAERLQDTSCKAG